MSGEKLPQVGNYIQRRRKMSVWHKLVLVMAMMVVFVTTYMLILPAITMESKAVCGKPEHTHTDA